MSRVLKVAGTTYREIFLTTFATLSTIFCSFHLFRDIKYPRLLNERFLTTFNTRDFFYSRLFHFWSKKSSRLLILCEIFGQNLHEIKKNRGIDRDIRDIKYPQHFLPLK